MIGKMRNNLAGIRTRSGGKNGNLLQLIGGLMFYPGKLTNFGRTLLEDDL